MSITVNTGVLFRKPGESTYAGVRRFLVANSTRAYRELVQQARESEKDQPKRSQKETILVRFAHRIETAFCKMHQLPPPMYAVKPPFGVATDSTALRIQRNCPVCVAGLFHSPLYDLPWLKRCPLHGETLTATCPACHHAWPTLNDLWTRQCVVCGIHLSGERFVAAQTRNIDWDFTRLEQLQACVDYPTRWGQMKLIVGHGAPSDQYDTYEHHQILLHDRNLPSIVAAVDSSHRSILEACGVSLEPCRRYRFRCRGAAVKSIPYAPESAPPHWMRDCQRQVIKKVAVAIGRSAGPKHHIDHYGGLFSRPGIVHCPYCHAFGLWWFLITRLPLRGSALGGAKVPQLMQLLIATSAPPVNPEAWLQWKREWLIPLYGYVLPPAAQRLFYTIDLWTSFASMFRSLEYYARPHHHCGSSEYASEPHPPFRYDFTRSIAFWKNSVDELEICVPADLFRASISTAYANHWVAICSQSEAQWHAKYRVTRSKFMESLFPAS